MKQIFLDTETTGLDPNLGHRVIEIAAIEIINRQQTNNRFHTYVNPLREIDAAAQEVHGITLDFLKDMPLFQDVASDFLEFIRGSEVIIHNAPFDVGFLDMELGKANLKRFEEYPVSIVDSLKMARDIRPGQRNNLNALCKYYQVDNSERSLHGALLDAELLGEVYLAMTRGQEALSIDFSESVKSVKFENVNKSDLKIVNASKAELKLNDDYFSELES
jgi:DNA polymerase-3 subunit epsilon